MAKSICPKMFKDEILKTLVHYTLDSTVEHEAWKRSFKDPAVFKATIYTRKYGRQQLGKSRFVRGRLTILIMVML